jgi:hypothetical protein
VLRQYVRGARQTTFANTAPPFCSARHQFSVRLITKFRSQIHDCTLAHNSCNKSGHSGPKHFWARSQFYGTAQRTDFGPFLSARQQKVLGKHQGKWLKSSLSGAHQAVLHSNYGHNTAHRETAYDLWKCVPAEVLNETDVYWVRTQTTAYRKTDVLTVGLASRSNRPSYWSLPWKAKPYASSTAHRCHIGAISSSVFLQFPEDAVQLRTGTLNWLASDVAEKTQHLFSYRIFET